MSIDRPTRLLLAAGHRGMGYGEGLGTVSRKHNTKHRRAVSNYPNRLKARGETSATVRMADLPTLRKRADRMESLSDAR